MFRTTILSALLVGLLALVGCGGDPMLYGEGEVSIRPSEPPPPTIPNCLDPDNIGTLGPLCGTAGHAKTRFQCWRAGFVPVAGCMLTADAMCVANCGPTAPDANPGLPVCAAPDGWSLQAAACPGFPGCRECLQAKTDRTSVGTVAGCWLPIEQAHCAAHCSECYR